VPAPIQPWTCSWSRPSALICSTFWSLSGWLGRELVWIYVTAYRPLNGSRGRLPKHLLGCPWLVIVVLALAAVIAQHSPAVRTLDKRVIARLFSFGVTPSCGRIVGVGISDKPARPVSSNCTPLRRSVQRFGAIVTTPVPIRIAPSLRADMIFREGRDYRCVGCRALHLFDGGPRLRPMQRVRGLGGRTAVAGGLVGPGREQSLSGRHRPRRCLVFASARGNSSAVRRERRGQEHARQDSHGAGRARSRLDSHQRSNAGHAFPAAGTRPGPRPSGAGAQPRAASVDSRQYLAWQRWLATRGC